MYNISQTNSVAAQVEILNKQMADVLAYNKSSVQSTLSEHINYCSNIKCEVCGEPGHTTLDCNILSKGYNQISEVSYAQNSPYSQSYNPNWRNHPNISYKGNSYGSNWQLQQYRNSNSRPVQFHHYQQLNNESRLASTFGSSQTVDSEAVKEKQDMTELPR
jgi:hypothetical protein